MSYKGAVNDVIGSWNTLDELWPNEPPIAGSFYLSTSIELWTAAHHAWASKIRGDYTIPESAIMPITIAKTNNPDLALNVVDREAFIRDLFTAAAREYQKGRVGLLKVIKG